MAEHGTKQAHPTQFPVPQLEFGAVLKQRADLCNELTSVTTVDVLFSVDNCPFEAVDCAIIAFYNRKSTFNPHCEQICAVAASPNDCAGAG